MKKFISVLLWFTLSIAGAAQTSKSRPAGAHKARAAAKPAQASRGNESVHLNNLGTAYMNQQQFKRALELFQQAAALDPKLEAARLNQAIALVSLQQYTPGLAALEAIVKSRPDNARAWYNIGVAYKDQGDSAKALDAFQHAAQLAPDDPDVFYFVGLMFSQIGQQKEAIAAFQHALELNPFHASAEFGLSRAFQRSGDGDKAREHLARFQHLTQTKLGLPMSLSYGDQGRLSLAVEAGNAGEPSAATVRVHFADITRVAGLAFSAQAQARRRAMPARAHVFLISITMGIPISFLPMAVPMAALRCSITWATEGLKTSHARRESTPHGTASPAPPATTTMTATLIWRSLHPKGLCFCTMTAMER